MIDQAVNEQVSSSPWFTVTTRARTGEDYPYPQGTSYQYALPVAYVTPGYSLTTGDRDDHGPSLREELCWSATWHPPGITLTAIRVDNQLYSLPSTERYTTRVYEADGSIRWSADYWERHAVVVNENPTTATRVCAFGGRVYVAGPRVEPEDPDIEPWSLVIYDEATGEVIRKVKLPDTPGSTGGATNGDALDIGCNGTPPTFSDATHVFVLMERGDNGSGGFSGNLIHRLDADGEFVDSESITAGGEGALFRMTRIGLRHDDLYAFGPRLVTYAHQYYGGGPYWEDTPTNTNPAPTDNLHSINFGRDDGLYVGTNAEPVRVINADGTIRWYGTSTGVLGVPKFNGTVFAAMGDESGNSFITHSRFTRLIGGNPEGTTGVSATGAISRWDNAGNVQWLIDLGSGLSEAGRALCLTTDDVLIVGGSGGCIGQVFTDGTYGWRHDHFNASDCSSLPNGASVFVGARRDMSVDRSFIQ